MSAGSGTDDARGRAWPGLVPQVTYGVSWVASSVTSWSNVASGSVGSERQYSSAASHSWPWGACGLSFRKAKVVSSGATRPARAPASIDLLQTGGGTPMGERAVGA